VDDDETTNKRSTLVPGKSGDLWDHRTHAY
jgi:hypothetical protein